MSLLGMQTTSAPAEARPLLNEALTELSSMLEELQVTSEELRAQSGELNESQGALRDELEHYRGLFTEALVPYLVTTPTGAIQECNHAACELLQRRMESLIGKPLPALIPLDVRDSFRSLLTELRGDGSCDRTATILRARDGVSIPVTLFVQKAFNPATQLPELRWVVRARGSETAASPEESLRVDPGLPDELVLALHGAASVEDVLDGALRRLVPDVAVFTMIDLAGVRGRRVRCAATHAEPDRRVHISALLAASSTAVVEFSHEASSHVAPIPATPDVMDALSANAAERDALQALQLVSCVSIPMQVADQTIGAIILGWNDEGPALPHDIATLQRAAARMAMLLNHAIEREASRKAADNATRALMTLAHDLRTPLGAIAQQLDVIEQRSPGEAAAQPLASIRHATDHLSNVLADVLTTGVASISSGAGAAEERFEAGSVLREVVVLLSPAAAARNVALHLATPETPLYVTTDRSRLQRALINLLDDAIARTAGGEIRLSVTGDSDGVSFTLSAREHGLMPGVSEPFWDAGKAADDSALRLEITSQLAASLGGALHVGNPASGLSTVALRLPAAQRSF